MITDTLAFSVNAASPSFYIYSLKPQGLSSAYIWILNLGRKEMNKNITTTWRKQKKLTEENSLTFFLLRDNEAETESRSAKGWKLWTMKFRGSNQ